MKKVKNFILKIVNHYKLLGRDKLDHFYTGALLFTFLSLFANVVWASLLTIAIATAKEISDSFKEERSSEFLDAFMSSLPVILYWIVELF